MTDPLTTLRALLPEGALSKTGEYPDALRTTYVSRDADECGRTYHLVDEDSADDAITELATGWAEALKNNAKSICLFCGETMSKDIDVMLEHARGCDKRPENRLLKRAEAAESALAKAEAETQKLIAANLRLVEDHADQCKRASAAESALAKAKAALAELEQTHDTVVPFALVMERDEAVARLATLTKERDRWEWVARDIAGAFDTRDAILADAIHRYDAAQKEASDAS